KSMQFRFDCRRVVSSFHEWRKERREKAQGGPKRSTAVEAMMVTTPTSSTTTVQKQSRLIDSTGQVETRKGLASISRATIGATRTDARGRWKLGAKESYTELFPYVAEFVSIFADSHSPTAAHS